MEESGQQNGGASPPPSYGAVGQMGNPYMPAPQPVSVAMPPTDAAAPVTGQPPAYQYPQPGQGIPAGGYPQEPPPKYEDPKGYPPQQPYPQQTPYTQTNYPPQGYQATTVYPVSHQTVILTDAGWGPIPRTVECPHCHSVVTSSTNYKPGALTWLAGGLLCLFGCWLGCCLIPFCMPDLQDVEHRCPNCGQHLGIHVRM